MYSSGSAAPATALFSLLQKQMSEHKAAEMACTCFLKCYQECLGQVSGQT